MKKVARLRIPPQDETAGTVEPVGVRTTGRIKKPKAVFDPSDNYLPRSHRVNVTANSSVSSSAGNTPTSGGGAVSILAERRKDNPTHTVQAQDASQSKRLSQSSGTSAGTTTTTTGSDGASVDVCTVCLKREAKRGTHAKNKLITCLECERRAHKLCLKVDFEDMDTLRQNYKCQNCRTCEVCDAFSDSEQKINQELVTCAKCVKSYHLTCHIPNVHKFQPVRHWKCNKCQLPHPGNGGMLPVNAIREIIGGESKPAKPQQYQSTQQQQVQQQQQQQHQSINIAAAAAEAKNAAVKRSLQELKNGTQKQTNGVDTDGDYDSEGAAHKKPKLVHESANNSTPMRYSPNEPLDVPDVKDWSVDQVEAYFAKYFPNEAYVFKEHEIDGTSLLLLKRSDVIKKLPIKLGPSLRIYSLILKIQTQINDPTLGWNCGL